MKALHGHIAHTSTGFHVAAQNLRPVMHLIEARMGLKDLVPGTLNIKIDQDYIVLANASISPSEYGFDETVKLQRCIIAGCKAIIMRPDTHETRINWGHGKDHLELMSPLHLRIELNLIDGDQVTVEVEGGEDWWAAGR
jgi:CTP-dependent riboflavin kinase